MTTGLITPVRGAVISQLFNGNSVREAKRYHQEYRGVPLATTDAPDTRFPGCDPIPQLHYHGAIDYAAAEGTPIVNAARSKVIGFGKQADGNLFVRCQIRPGTTISYSHCSRFRSGIYIGQVIAQGSTVAYVGHTGNASGDHCHFVLKITEKDPDGVTRTYLYDSLLFTLNNGSAVYPYLYADHRVAPVY